MGFNYFESLLGTHSGTQKPKQLCLHGMLCKLLGILGANLVEYVNSTLLGHINQVKGNAKLIILSKKIGMCVFTMLRLLIYVTIHKFRVHFESLTIVFRNRMRNLERGKGLIRKEISIQNRPR